MQSLIEFLRKAMYNHALHVTAIRFYNYLDTYYNERFNAGIKKNHFVITTSIPSVLVNVNQILD